MRPRTIRLRDEADVSIATSRIAATGGIRDARRAGNERGHDGDVDADDEADDDRARQHDEGATREVEAERVEERVSADRDEDAEREADDRRDQADRDALERAPTLSTCLRLAPIARSSASSRPRCATRIEKVL